MRRIALLTTALLIAASPAHAADPDANEIIRSLAPITYLPKHGGKPRRAIDLEIRFEIGSAKLTKSARSLLARLATALKDQRLAASRFEVAGHTDASGKRAYNQKLSERRARTVVAFLANSLGVKRSRLTASGKGEDALKDPLNANSSANRRVEIINLTPVKPTAAIKKSGEKKANDILMGK
ncbi:MAG: OmpA family protein [Alphaproteobacteria bacterium]|jgi:outer membrane protein OmpA-like peptidoglycan-associated protein|nr:OmpA family protein [Alphaproteobacteria bacterium]